MRGMADECNYPSHPVDPVHAERCRREFAERQRRHRNEIRERKRLSKEAVRIARETGDASKLRSLKPLYE